MKDTEIKLVKQIIDKGDFYQTLDQCFLMTGNSFNLQTFFHCYNSWTEPMLCDNVTKTTTLVDGESSLYSPYLRFLLGGDLCWLW